MAFFGGILIGIMLTICALVLMSMGGKDDEMP